MSDNGVCWEHECYSLVCAHVTEKSLHRDTKTPILCACSKNCRASVGPTSGRHHRLNFWMLHVCRTARSAQCRTQWFAIRSRPNQIADPGPKSGPARKSESRGPENGVSRWRRPNSDIYSQNHHFGLVYDMIYQFLGMEAKNYKFGIFCQQCHPSVASGDADIQPRNASRIHTCHLFTS